MSSHHIVREKQEPALLVLSLDDFDDELLGQLLEWSPTVMATPLTAEQINSQGIKVDVIIGMEPGPLLQSDVRLIPANDNALKAAMTFLIGSDYKAVNIIADEPALDQLGPYAGLINLVIFSGAKKIYPVTSGFSKWKPGGESIELLSPAENLQTTGLEFLSKDNYITTGNGFFTLSFTGDFVFIAEDL